MTPVAELIADLTPPQRDAAMHVDGPLLIIAGAGSGKTRVITRRVAYLISQGIPASSLLAITFTNKAAGEMKSRVQALLERPLRDFGRLDQPWPTICTFHSLCLRILRHYAERVGLPPNFTVFDSSDQTKLLKEAIKTLDISSTNFAPATVHSTISRAKNELITAGAFAAQPGDFYQRTVARIYTKYQQMLDASGALDFDDLLLRVAHALRDFPDVLEGVQERFRYICIDEYQDTNHVQYVMAHAMAAKHRNICVVGDPDQSIYAWRGADIQNILDFEKDYPDAKVVRLEQNYRSTKTILALASKLISNNSQRKDKALWTENPEGGKVPIVLCQDEHDEAEYVKNELKHQHETGRSWNEMAVFYRMNSLSRVIEERLFKAQIPYQVARGIEFYNRKEIKDVLAYLRVIANPADEVSLERVVNTPTRGISDASVAQMKTHGAAMGMGLWGAMTQAHNVPTLTTRAVKSVQQFVTLVESWRKLHNTLSPAAAAVMPSREAPAPSSSTSIEEELAAMRDAGDVSDYGEVDLDDMFAHVAPVGPAKPLAKAPVVVEEVQPDPETGEATQTPTKGVRALMEDVVKRSGLEAALRKLGDKEQAEMANVNELLSAAAEYDKDRPDGSLADYLANVSLMSDADHMKGAGGAVTLMTLHAAKGLEFPFVAIVGIEEGCLPHSRARGNIKELEEERRLFFVGITRAEEQLLLTKSAYRTMRGLRERTVTSPFLNELPLEHLEIIDRTGLSPAGGASRDSDAFEPPENAFAKQFKQGMRVRHPTFGIGRITTVTDMGQHTRAEVDFNQVGRKTLILQYARLEAVG